MRLVDKPAEYTIHDRLRFDAFMRRGRPMLEAFLAASKRVDEFYQADDRIVTEHALIDDTGDQLGTSANFYQGLRPAQQTVNGKPVDGQLAARWFLHPGQLERRLSSEQRQARDALEKQIAQLKASKSQLDVDDYYAQLDRLAIRLARLYATLDEEPTESERKN